MIESTEKTEMKQKKTVSWLYYAAMVLVLILSAVSYIAGHWTDGRTSRNINPVGEFSSRWERSEKTRVLKEKLQQKILQEEKKFQQKNTEIINDFESRLQEILKRNFDAADNAIPSVVKDFSGFGACNKFCYKMARQDHGQHTRPGCHRKIA